MKPKFTAFYEQYLSLKKQAADSVLLVELGEFYEAFNDDAQIVHKVADKVLTSRRVSATLSAPMAGIPKHAVNTLVHELTHAGHNVAIASQHPEIRLESGCVLRTITHHMYATREPFLVYLDQIAKDIDESVPTADQIAEYLLEALDQPTPYLWRVVDGFRGRYPVTIQNMVEEWIAQHMDSILQALVDDIDAALYEPYGSPLEVSACQSYIKRHHMPQWCFGMLIDLYSYHS